METLNVYIPADRRVALSKGQSLPNLTNGAVLFVDISGFTTLTEMLSQKLGTQRGAEEVTYQLELIYSALILQVHNYMGSVITFSGDAIICWFDGDDGRRATTCAFTMQKEMMRFQAVHTAGGAVVSFSIKAGIAMGPARRFLVGKPRIRAIEVLAGTLLDRVASAEKLAQRGRLSLERRSSKTYTKKRMCWNGEPQKMANDLPSSRQLRHRCLKRPGGNYRLSPHNKRAIGYCLPSMSG